MYCYYYMYGNYYIYCCVLICFVVSFNRICYYCVCEDRRREAACMNHETDDLVPSSLDECHVHSSSDSLLPSSDSQSSAIVSVLKLVIIVYHSSNLSMTHDKSVTLFLYYKSISLFFNRFRCIKGGWVVITN